MTEWRKADWRRLVSWLFRNRGNFANDWMAEYEAGLPRFKAYRTQEAKHPVEVVGQRLRAMMPFLDPVKLPQPVTV